MQNHDQNSIQNQNTNSIITPLQLKNQFPLTDIDRSFIKDSQNIIINIVQRKDPRLLIICGPCSIHDPDSAIDYANKLKKLAIKLKDQLYIVMRVYLEKPRTVVGWKGLISDPYLNGSGDIEHGLKISRHLLLKLIRIGLPIATEVLNPIFTQYLGEIFSWIAIGARTTESQIHREIASGFQSAVGFKNSTNGNIEHAINAIRSSSMSHKYININQYGQACLYNTAGNFNGHIILRGGNRPNYYSEDIIYCEKKLKQSKLPLALVVDCSHDNSYKDYRRQGDVLESVLYQIQSGNISIIGLMLESYIYSGNQILNFNNLDLQYGISITDSCISWETTEQLLLSLYKKSQPFLVKRLVKGD